MLKNRITISCKPSIKRCINFQIQPNTPHTHLEGAHGVAAAQVHVQLGDQQRHAALQREGQAQVDPGLGLVGLERVPQRHGHVLLLRPRHVHTAHLQNGVDDSTENYLQSREKIYHNKNINIIIIKKLIFKNKLKLKFHKDSPW